jgi:hypothetical protein
MARGEGPSSDPGALRREIEAFALDRLRRAVPDEARDWCGVEERVSAGKPYREILRMAAEETADLIVMGAHARGALDRLFLGSNASQVVRQAACPVLIVRPTEPRPGLEAEEAGVTTPASQDAGRRPQGPVSAADGLTGVGPAGGPIHRPEASLGGLPHHGQREPADQDDEEAREGQ